MGKIRRKFDIQFKIRVCQSIEAGLHTVAEVSREHQIQRPVIEGWMGRYVEGSLQAKSVDRQSELERENEKLRAKIGELTMTVDLLKKVEAWKRRQTSATSSIITPKNLAQFQKPAKQPVSPAQATTISRNGTR